MFVNAFVLWFILIVFFLAIVLKIKVLSTVLKLQFLERYNLINSSYEIEYS